MADDPKWFLGTLVVKLASPLLLGDAVGALRAAGGASAVACSAKAGTAAEVRGEGPERNEEEAARVGMDATLRDVVLPGAVERLTKVSKGWPWPWPWPRQSGDDQPPCSRQGCCCVL